MYYNNNTYRKNILKELFLLDRHITFNLFIFLNFVSIYKNNDFQNSAPLKFFHAINAYLALDIFQQQDYLTKITSYLFSILNKLNIYLKYNILKTANLIAY